MGDDYWHWEMGKAEWSEKPMEAQPTVFIQQIREVLPILSSETKWGGNGVCQRLFFEWEQRGVHIRNTEQRTHSVTHANKAGGSERAGGDLCVFNIRDDVRLQRPRCWLLFTRWDDQRASMSLCLMLKSSIIGERVWNKHQLREEAHESIA